MYLTPFQRDKEPCQYFHDEDTSVICHDIAEMLRYLGTIAIHFLTVQNETIIVVTLWQKQKLFYADWASVYTK